MEHGLLLVISGPSGVGKGTIVKAVKESFKNLNYSISATTRPPRTGEKDGVDYYFISKEEFLHRIVQRDFLEHAIVYDNFYGTPRGAVLGQLAEGKDVVLEIDINGALQVKSNFPEAVLIYVSPPSFQELEDRLTHRETDSQEVINRRLQCVHEELRYMSQYDYIVVNDQLSRAVANVSAILTAERCRAQRVMESNNYLAAIDQEGSL